MLLETVQSRLKSLDSKLPIKWSFNVRVTDVQQDKIEMYYYLRHMQSFPQHICHFIMYNCYEKILEFS